MFPLGVPSPEAGRPDAALHPRGEHVQPLVRAVGPGRGHALQRPGETHAGLTRCIKSVLVSSHSMLCGAFSFCRHFFVASMLLIAQRAAFVLKGNSGIFKPRPYFWHEIRSSAHREQFGESRRPSEDI